MSNRLADGVISGQQLFLRQFGGSWLAMHLIRTLQLDSFLEKVIPKGRESVPWDVTSRILIIARLLFTPHHPLTCGRDF